MTRLMLLTATFHNEGKEEAVAELLGDDDYKRKLFQSESILFNFPLDQTMEMKNISHLLNKKCHLIHFVNGNKTNQKYSDTSKTQCTALCLDQECNWDEESYLFGKKAVLLGVPTQLCNTPTTLMVLWKHFFDAWAIKYNDLANVTSKKKLPFCSPQRIVWIFFLTIFANNGIDNLLVVFPAIFASCFAELPDDVALCDACQTHINDRKVERLFGFSKHNPFKTASCPNKCVRLEAGSFLVTGNEEEMVF
eukprot:3541061-Rhodomonas_salina.1